MNRDAAEIFALQVLEWLAADAELIGSFLASTGMNAGDIRELMQSPELQLAVLDFVLQADQTVLSCAQALNCPPEHLLQARAALPGGQEYHWT